MSNTSHYTAALRQHLASIVPGQPDLLDLVVRYYTDPAAGDALCDHEEGSVPLLVAVYTSLDRVTQIRRLEYQMIRGGCRETYKAAHRFGTQAKSRIHTQLAHATEAYLLEGLRVARNGLPAENPYMLSAVSLLFAEHGPLAALTDRVTAEMSWSVASGLSPELGAGPPTTPGHCGDIDRIRWLMSSYLYNRFGDHDPSWVMFKHVHGYGTMVGDTADHVAYLHTRFGDHDPSWNMFNYLYTPSRKAVVGDTADHVAYLHNRFGEHEPSWNMFRKLWEPSQTVDDVADLVVAIEHA